MKPIEILRHHCVGRHDIEGFKENGFQSKLRPFTEVSEFDFRQIIDACQTLYIETDGQSINKDVIYQVSGCTQKKYTYALKPDSMLVRNKLINEEIKPTFTTMEEWITNKAA